MHRFLSTRDINTSIEFRNFRSA